MIKNMDKNQLHLNASLFSIVNYLIKIFVIYSMDKETMNLYDSCEGLNNTVFEEMSIQELFDIRHDMLDLMNKLGQLLSE